jgi:hypothetical protein
MKKKVFSRHDKFIATKFLNMNSHIRIFINLVPANFIIKIKEVLKWVADAVEQRKKGPRNNSCDIFLFF